MGQDIEIELKLPLKNSAAVAKFLDKHAKFKRETKQHDIYFNPPHRDFLANPDNVDEWFRIRLAGDSAQINYKDFQPHDQVVKTHCTEYETDVASYDQLNKILAALNFVKLVDVKKLRKIWDYGDVEVSLDSVDELGDFIEVEYKGEAIGIEAARKHLFAALKELGAEPGEIDYRGYPYLLMEKKGLLNASNG